MVAKCSYIEKVGSVYYVRKRIPRAWKLSSGGDVLRMSLRTKHRPMALRLGLGALAVFEDLFGMEKQEALKHLLKRLIDEQMLRPELMTGADLIRRRALEAAGKKLLKDARLEFNVKDMFPSLYEEFVHFNHATVRGENFYERRTRSSAAQPSVTMTKLENPNIDLSGLNELLGMIDQQTPQLDVVQPRPGVPAPSVQLAHPKTVQEVGWTMRRLMDDYMARDGKETGSDNKTNSSGPSGCLKIYGHRPKQLRSLIFRWMRGIRSTNLFRIFPGRAERVLKTS